MIRITADTNVLISASFWHGASEKIIDKVEKKELVLVLSEEILEEYARVLNYDDIQQKIKDKHLEMKQALLRIGMIAEIIIPHTTIDIVKDDPADNKIIACAVDGMVHYLITKDNHLLKHKEYQGIRILTPETFLQQYSNSPDTT